MKRLAILTAVGCVVVGSAAVWAGSQSTMPVSITYDNTGTVVTGADGSLVGAFLSADANQELGCGGGATLMFCQAHDARDDQRGLLNAAFCTTSDANLIAQIRSVTANSHVRFTLDPLTGRCTSVFIDRSSTFLQP